MTRTRGFAALAAVVAAGSLTGAVGVGLASNGSEVPLAHDRGSGGGDPRATRTDGSGSGGDDRARRREIRRAGTCSGSSRSKIKVKGESRNRLDIEFEVDQNRNGQRWGVVLKDNGRAILRRVYRTRAPSGSFEARRITANRPGRDRIVATARNTRTGERCAARVVF